MLTKIIHNLQNVTPAVNGLNLPIFVNSHILVLDHLVN